MKLLWAKYKLYAAVAVWLLSVGVVGVQSWRLSADHQIAKQAKDEALIARVAAAAQAGAAVEIAKIKPINRYNESVINNETRIVPDYSQCNNSAAGLSAINAALEGRRAEPPRGGILPDADSAR